MGALVSKSPAKLRSDDIDRQLHEDGKCSTHEYKILLLGTYFSLMSTLFLRSEWHVFLSSL